MATACTGHTGENAKVLTHKRVRGSTSRFARLRIRAGIASAMIVILSTVTLSTPAQTTTSSVYADGLASGCWHASAALVDRFVDRSAALLGGSPIVTLGGGDAGVLAPLLERDVLLVPDTVLRGLAVWANRQPAPANIA